MSTDATRPSHDDQSAASPPSDHRPTDLVRARRQQIAKWTLIANRVGYLFYAFSIVAFVLAFALGFNATMSAIVIGSLVIGSILLAPAIVLGYAVKAAERDDRERGF